MGLRPPSTSRRCDGRQICLLSRISLNTQHACTCEGTREDGKHPRNVKIPQSSTHSQVLFLKRPQRSQRRNAPSLVRKWLGRSTLSLGNRHTGINSTCRIAAAAAAAAAASLHLGLCPLQRTREARGAHESRHPVVGEVGARLGCRAKLPSVQGGRVHGLTRPAPRPQDTSQL